MIIEVWTTNTYFSDGMRVMMVKLVYPAEGGGKAWMPVWRCSWHEEPQ